MSIKISGFQVGAQSPTLSSSGTYYFRIHGNSGLINKNSLFDAAPTAYDINTMTNIVDSYFDDNSYEIGPAFPVVFLSNTYATLQISGNNSLSFGSQNNDRRGSNNPPEQPDTENGDPAIYLNNNDSCMNSIYMDVQGTAPYRTMIIKVKGNTDYNINSSPNYEYDYYFYENGGGNCDIDVVVVSEPTSWSAYSYAQGEVLWGVSNGAAWIDGLTYHRSSLGAA